MTDRTAASVGGVLSGVAFAATLVGWLWRGSSVPPETAILAVTALAVLAIGAFWLRWTGRLERTVGAVVAGIAALGVVATGAVGVWRGDVLAAMAVAAVGGAGAAIAAYADLRGLDRDALLARVGAASLGGFLGVAGIAMLFVWQIVLILILAILSIFVPWELSAQAVTALSTLTLGAGTLTVAVLYLHLSGRDWSFVDLEWPSLRQFGYVLAGIVGVLGANVAIALLLQELQVESATHSVVETARTTGEPSMLLVLVPLSYLVIAPGEELLYRNVIQKSLRETFSPVGGVVVASAIFALVHFPAYWNPSLLATLTTLVVIFAMALVLGGIYERTRNVVVPILVHGTFNALAFLANYAELVGMVG